MAQIGNQIFHEKELGHGGYGNVFICRDQYHQRFAVKKIPNGRSGIESPLEPVVMSSIIHPCLARSVKSQVIGNELVIFSELAMCDGTKYVKDFGVLKGAALQHMAFSIIQAITCLHLNQIIHGDIKSSNILFFPSSNFSPSSFSSNNSDGTRGRWKLTDFSHSVIFAPNFPKYHRVVSTNFYRPLETYSLSSNPLPSSNLTHSTNPHHSPNLPHSSNEEGWDMSLDIWCYGCMLYDMAYGQNFITRQSVSDNGKNLSHDTKAKKENELSMKYRNVLIDWLELYPVDSSKYQKNHQISYQPLKLAEGFSLPSVFNSLVKKLLHPLGHGRPTCQMVMEDSYFSDIIHTKMSATILGLDGLVNRESEELKKIRRKMVGMVKELQMAEVVKQKILEISVNIYYQTEYLEEKVRKDFAVWFANKVVCRNKSSVDDRILQAEKRMATVTQWLVL